MALLPALGLIDNYIFHFSLVFDHFRYLASIGPLALVGARLARLPDFIIPKKPWRQSSLCAGLLLVLGMSSWRRAWAYESEEKLWTDALAKNPDCWIGHNNLGNILLQKALGINPNDLGVNSNLGEGLLQKGQLDEPIAHFQKALELNPNYPEAHCNLGLALFEMG